MYHAKRECCWWWTKIWKVRALKKTKKFMWVSLKNKVPTWDILKQRNEHGPSIFYLSKNDDENVLHLFSL